MKKRLVALVLCLVTLLGCVGARAEDDDAYFLATILPHINLSAEDCRISGSNRALIAINVIVEYLMNVDDAYSPDLTQPIYVSAFAVDSDTYLIVNFFSEDNHHVQLLFTAENAIVIYSVNAETPSYVKSCASAMFDWTYSPSSSEINTATKKLKEIVNELAN